MPIVEIINEIDAYLSRLRQARELLSGHVPEAGQKSQPRRNRTILVKPADTAFSSTPRTKENKPRSNPSIAHQNSQKQRGEPDVQVSSDALPQATDTEHSVIARPERTIPEGIVIKRIPVRRRIGSVRSMGLRTAKPVVTSRPDAIKPAIALAGPPNTKIVVVSAEQVQRQREQTAHPPVLRPRMPAAGLSGRTAFEALFANQSDHPKTSGD